MLNISTIFAHVDEETPIRAEQSDSETVFMEIGNQIGIWLPFQKARELRNALDAAIPFYAPAEPESLRMTSEADTQLPAEVTPEPLKDPEEVCGDYPPIGYPTDKTRCEPCPRRVSPEQETPLDDESTEFGAGAGKIARREQSAIESAERGE